MYLPLFQIALALTPCLGFYYFSLKIKEFERAYTEREFEKTQAETRISIEPEASQEILSDIRQKGFTVIRLDSNDLFYRSPKG